MSCHMIQAKDDGDISDAAYNELKQVPASNLPSLCSVVKERNSLNNIIEIKEFEVNVMKNNLQKYYVYI